METALQIMVEGIELKELEALEYLWRPFCGLKKAYCVRWSQRNGAGVNQEPIKTETGEAKAVPAPQTN